MEMWLVAVAALAVLIPPGTRGGTALLRRGEVDPRPERIEAAVAHPRQRRQLVPRRVVLVAATQVGSVLVLLVIGIAAGGVRDPDLFMVMWLDAVVAELVAVGCWMRLAVPSRTAPVPVAG